MKYLRFSSHISILFSVCLILFSAAGVLSPLSMSVKAASDAGPAGDAAGGSTSGSQSDISWPAGPSVKSDSAVVMDLSTGTVIYEKNADKAEYPASITKIMTALLAVENCSMDEIVEFSETAIYGNGANSSSIGVNVGERLSMENCMYGMLLASGNEVAKAIGEHISGSLDTFVEKMNEKARELGCVNTHFANPNGLHDENHYTCAYDMALIAQAAIQNSTFRKVAGTRVYTIPPTEMTDEDRWVANTHQMINPSKLPQYAYEDCYAGKTGFTDEARYTLVTFAERGNLDLVCVTMHAQMQTDQYDDTIKLLDYAFDNFSVHAINKLDNAPSFDNFSLFTRFSPLFDMEKSPLSIDMDSSIILPNGASYSDVKQSITYHALNAIEKGSNVIGEISYQYGDKKVGFTDILYESAESLLIEQPDKTTSADGTETAGKTTAEGSSKPNLKPWIITGICLFLIVLGGLYFWLIELPHRRRRRAYYERRRKRREQDHYLDL